MSHVPQIDVAINVYGKPYQTAVTLLSLLRHSGQHINKIYFVAEKKQPPGTDYSFIFEALGERVIRYKPAFFFWYNPIKYRFLLRLPFFRHSIRYQYAWEKSDRPYLLIMHNDVLYTGDLVGQYLSHIGQYVGIGKVGQCWNCPAHTAGLCGGDRYWAYRPSADELLGLARQFPGPRTDQFPREVAQVGPWPTPECRLNEYTCLINLEKARPLTLPEGPAPPFGDYNGLDVATRWFNAMGKAGMQARHFDYDPYATHDWVNERNNGHAALFDKAMYDRGEAMALRVLQEEYGIFPEKR